MHGMVEQGRRGRASTQTLARIGGVLYLIIIVGGGFSEIFVRARTIVPSDPAATAANILSNELLWRVGIAGEYLMLVCTVALALILYILLRPVNRDLALLAVLFNLVSIAVEATNELRLLLSLLPLRSADSLGAFDPGQLQALSYLTT